MNSSQKKKADALAALSAVDRARLDRLAARAEVSAEAIWNEVWLYGFEDIEESVDADLDAQEDIAGGRTIPHEEVMAQARRNLESNVPREKKQAEALASLSATDHARLERLAARADVTPEAIWPDVWLYGFDDVEEGIRADIEADEYFKSNVGIDNVEVMAEVRNLIAIHGKPRL